MKNLDILLKHYRSLNESGIPDTPGIRQKSWKSFVRDLLADPYEEYGSSGQDDHVNTPKPLNSAPNSKWAEYFADNIILEQIDKDVRRTLPDIAFFQSPVPQSPLSPLSPRLGPLALSRLNGARSPSIFDALDSVNDDVSSVVSRDSDTVVGNGTSSSLTSETTATSEIRSVPSTPCRPTPIDVDAALAVPVMPIPTRRSIFKRVQHLNKDFSTRDKRPGSPVLGNGACDDDDIVDLHWEAIERILFIYAKLNPGIGYVQGMNEILGPIYYTMANDDDEEGKAHAEADAFFVFTLLMADIRDHFVRTLDSDDLNGIGATMSKLSKRLKLHAREQWEDM
ncbi:10819_t:CDS:2, partial [Paraglomus occultum]